MKKFIFLISIVFFVFLAFVRCSENSISMFVGVPETLKREKAASFYGTQALKNCEAFRRLYSSYCDMTTHSFITCHDLNEKKYKLSSCE